MGRPEKIRLGDVLVAQKLISPEQLKQALETQKRGGRKLGRVLVEEGILTEQDLGEGVFDFGILGATLGAEEAPVVKLLQSLFEDAMQVGASDIHIEPQESRLQIRIRVDGVLHVQTEADNRIASAVALRLKLMSGLDISEKRQPQDGRFNVKVRDQTVDVRMSTLPTQHGESVVMRILNRSSALLDLDSLGMPADMLERFRSILGHVTGMVL